MDNISIGTYIPSNSFAHKLDPRVKLFYNIIFVIMVFLTESFIKIFIISIPVLTLFFIYDHEPKKVFKIFLTVFFIGFFLFWINAFMANNEVNHSTVTINDNKWYLRFWSSGVKEINFNGRTIEQETYWFKISTNVIRMTFLVMLRIFMMILVTTILIETTKPSGLTKAIDYFLSPLRLIKFPTKIISMIISLALRFIPTLLNETQRIMKAQASRGVDFKNGNLKAKFKSIVSLIIPLFVSSFSKAEDLGNAMEVRGYDPYGKRTEYRKYSLKAIDYFIISIIISSLLFVILSMPNIYGNHFSDLNNIIFSYK